MSEEIYRESVMIEDTMCKITTLVEGDYRPYISTIVKLETDIAKYFKIFHPVEFENLREEINDRLVLVNREYFYFDIISDAGLKLHIYSKPDDYNTLKKAVQSEAYQPIVEAIVRMFLKYSTLCELHENNVLCKAAELIQRNVPILAVDVSEDSSFEIVQIVSGEYNVPERHAKVILEYLSGIDSIKEYSMNYLLSQKVERITVSDVFNNAEVETEKMRFPVLKDIARKLSEKSGVEISLE